MVSRKPTYAELEKKIQELVKAASAHQLAEKSLRKSEAHLRALLNTLPDLIWLKDVDGIYLSCNPRFERFFGSSEDEIIGKTDYDFLSNELADFFREKDKAAIAAGKSCRNEEEVRFADDGHREILETIKTSMVNSDGKPTGLLGIARDITHRKQAEGVLQYQERLLQDMGRIAKVGGWEFDPATGQGTWTEEVARIHDMDPDSETNMELGLSFYHGSSRTKIENAIRAAIEFGAPYDLELELISAKGIRKWVRSIGKPSIQNGNVIQLRGSFQDITASKLAEQRIEHLNRVLKAMRDINQLIVHERDPAALLDEGCRLMVDNRGYSAALIVQTDEHEKPILWAINGLNLSVEQLEGLLEKGDLPPCFERVRDEKEAVLINDRLGFCGMCPVAEACAQMYSLCARLSHGGTNYGYLVVAMDEDLCVDDEERSIFNEMAGDLAYALSVVESEKKRKSLEKQLSQAQKMESVGRLAGGVAHDYNNMLSIIIGYAELALENVDPDSHLYSDLNEILKAANRSTEITRQLLAFARKQTIAPKVLDLNDTVENMLKMLRRLIGEDIELGWLPGSELGPIKIDPSQVDQILANLCVNARDAINGIGKIIIQTRNCRCESTYCADHAGLVPGDYILLTVSDNGCGMDKKTQLHLFEPFFTTKEKGKGTGLGMATVYGIVKQNKGFIDVNSEPGKGTNVNIYLPRHQASEKDKEEHVMVQSDARGSETILLVEDEQTVLRMTKTTLERFGYTVLTANEPAEAIKMAREHSGKIQLLVTDVVMPGMNGKALSNNIKELNPDMKTLFMSGYTATAIAHREVLDDDINFVQKPFSIKNFALNVRDVLDGGIG